MLIISNKKKYFISGAILLLIFFHYLGWLKFMENLFRSGLIPISSIIYNSKNNLSNKYDTFKKRRQLSDLYQKCLANNKTIAIQSTQIETLQQENEKLKAAANFKVNTKYHLITANIVGKTTNNVEKLLIADAGEAEQIKIGQAVIALEGILVGRVAKVEKNISLIRLINDNQSKIAATIMNRQKSLGVVEGGYGLSVRMNLIPRDEIVMIGDKIITSGLDTNIPRGLLIGEVAVSENEAYQPFQQAILTPAIDLAKLSIISIIITK